jgi:probable rRNA maturation factor
VKVHLCLDNIDEGESESSKALRKLEGREEILERVVNHLFPEKYDDQEAEVSISIVSPSEMQEKNREYREIDEPTDVLSFPMWEENGEFLPPQGWDILPLGDILICEEIVRENASQNNVSFIEELYLMVAHGFLHLLGLDHDTEEKKEAMWNLQFRIRENWCSEQRQGVSPIEGGLIL